MTKLTKYQLRSVASAAIALVVSMAVSTSAYAELDASDFKAKSADHFEHTIDFMVTMAVGGLAVIGYLVKEVVVERGLAKWWQMGFALLAASLGGASLFFAYQSYLSLVEVTGNGAFVYASLSKVYGCQATFLLLEGFAILALLGVSGIWRERSTQ